MGHSQCLLFVLFVCLLLLLFCFFFFFFFFFGGGGGTEVVGLQNNGTVWDHFRVSLRLRMGIAFLGVC